MAGHTPWTTVKILHDPQPRTEERARIHAQVEREMLEEIAAYEADMAAADEDLAAGRTRSAADVFGELDGTA